MNARAKTGALQRLLKQLQKTARATPGTPTILALTSGLNVKAMYSSVDQTMRFVCYRAPERTNEQTADGKPVYRPVPPSEKEIEVIARDAQFTSAKFVKGGTESMHPWIMLEQPDPIF